MLLKQFIYTHKSKKIRDVFNFKWLISNRDDNQYSFIIVLLQLPVNYIYNNELD